MGYRTDCGQDNAQFKPKRKIKVEKVNKDSRNTIDIIVFVIQLILLIRFITNFCNENFSVAGRLLLSIIVVGLFGFFWKYNYSFEKE